MVTINVKTFKGIAPRTPARYINNDQAQVALNCPVFSGSLRPLKDLGPSLLTLPKAGTPKTIYRYGQDLVSDTQYWFHWDKDVDVCRGQIAGDTSEWTFYTGDGPPKATYSAIALTGSEYPAASRSLGVPAPTTAASTDGGTKATPDETTAATYITASDLSAMQPGDDISISTTTPESGEYSTVAVPATVTPASVASAINAASLGVTATESGSGVELDRTASGTGAAIYLKLPRGSVTDTSSSPTYVAPNLSGVGFADADPFFILDDTEIGSIQSGDTITLSTEAGQVLSVVASSSLSSSGLVSLLTPQLAGKLTAEAHGSLVQFGPGSEATGATGKITYARDSGGSQAFTKTAEGSESAAAAGVIVTRAHLDANAGGHFSVKVGSYENPMAIPDNPTILSAGALTEYNLDVDYMGSIDPIAIVTTRSVGSQASVTIRGATYPTFGLTQDRASTSGGSESLTESRVYTYTWVAKEAGYDRESGPAPASDILTVELGQAVDLSGFDSIPSGSSNITHKRIYRSVQGIYLFVDEIPAASSTYTDNSSAEELNEEMPSLYWSEPPDDLEGLINLPNGMMAGFVGRDVYFCEPYRPHAWPEPYMQTVDYPVVGLGRMDTTLAVLTTGVPYFMQGSHPDAVAVVKSDIEQACVSKESIVSASGAVVYAAPDGLILLSSGGSRNLTEQLFDYKTWQAYFAPESIHAYQHDNRYIAFYTVDGVQGGFTYDLPTGQFALHNLYAEAGYHDLQRDKLFLAEADKELRVWDAGDALTYLWRSKVFTMPQNTGFSCAQLEAEAYPMTLRVFRDGTMIHEETVRDRRPFRLPSGVGRDWELEVEGELEVFSVSLSTSMTELANG